jgi:phosphoribosylamine--glycine ligase
MRILVVGSGGREHTLAWKLAQSSQTDRLFVAPGNGGTTEVAQNIPISGTDIPALVKFAKKEQIDLTVVGPEAPLVAGLVDAFQEADLRAFGPTAAAARLEGSKAFSKRFMIEEGIPSGVGAIFKSHTAALAYLREQKAPIVIKASGLAAGKGVAVCSTIQEAESALHDTMVERIFGAAGDETLVEDCLVGEEASLLAFCDGKTVVPMIPARDYKRVGDGDTGPNTGGLGCYAPSPHLPPEMIEEAHQRVLQPTVDGMRRRGMPYIGILYAGLMLTEHGMRVLEFNCRFGDPETQVLLPLLENDLVDIFLACLESRLDEIKVRWKADHAVCVVKASGGYPGAYEKGKIITGVDKANTLSNTFVFQAGTALKEGNLVTSGGRVLAATSVGQTRAEARAQAYKGITMIDFEGAQNRSDIATGGTTGS